MYPTQYPISLQCHQWYSCKVGAVVCVATHFASLFNKGVVRCSQLFDGPPAESPTTHYQSSYSSSIDPAIIFNDVQVPQVHEVIHYGHKFSDDIYKFSSTKCVEDFNRQSNTFLANFKHANSNIRNALFQNYCTSFYGSQILPLFGNCMEDFLFIYFFIIIWRISIQLGKL